MVIVGERRCARACLVIEVYRRQLVAQPALVPVGSGWPGAASPPHAVANAAAAGAVRYWLAEAQSPFAGSRILELRTIQKNVALPMSFFTVVLSSRAMPAVHHRRRIPLSRRRPFC